MNPGPVEEAGTTARETVHALSTTPALLALIVLQFVTLGVIAWSNYQRNIYESDLNKLLVSLCKTTSNDGSKSACIFRNESGG